MPAPVPTTISPYCFISDPERACAFLKKMVEANISLSVKRL
jgi:tRNA-dihydrouridine synthase